MEYELKILGESPRTDRKRRVVAQCVCGNIKTYQEGNLQSGGTVSCGCGRLTGVTKHGMHGSKTYEIWSAMVARCSRSGYVGWHRYGGRGITVCERWKKFENFYADMGERPQGKQLDRIDNNKGYFRDNCRWVTHKENCNNKESSIKVNLGFFLLTIPELAELGLMKRRGMYKRWHKYKNVWDCLFPPEKSN
jgi:hypothetical protein